MIFKKPIDPDKHLSEEEREEKLARFRQNDFDKEDERAMIWAALKTFLPAVLLVMGIFALVAWLIIRMWTG